MTNILLWLLCQVLLLIFIVLIGVITFKLEGDVITPIILFIFISLGNYGAYVDRKESDSQ